MQNSLFGAQIQSNSATANKAEHAKTQKNEKNRWKIVPQKKPRIEHSKARAKISKRSQRKEHTRTRALCPSVRCGLTPERRKPDRTSFHNS
jgi:hypothetical protein